MTGNDDLIQGLAARWNEADEERFLELFHPDIEFGSSESWPENEQVTGLAAVRAFWHEFRSVWDEISLEVREVRGSREVQVGRCDWLTRGRVSGAESTMEFYVALWRRGELIGKGQFFDSFEEALEAASLS